MSKPPIALWLGIQKNFLSKHPPYQSLTIGIALVKVLTGGPHSVSTGQVA